MHRAVEQRDGAYALREQSETYNGVFGGESAENQQSSCRLAFASARLRFTAALGLTPRGVHY